MSYLVFARKYRPQKFNEVIGQEQVVFTLLNSLKYNRIAQAYIFSGPRGVGKTTIARIYAKALNCLDLKDDLEPCCKCENCISIKNGNNIDVVEIDGASNTGIEDIRKLRENVKFPPSSSKYKVIIIDEVHMLSKNAFNGLLKTLEEPPDYIIFMFATTELHKIPETILSRCQKFYFNRITDAKMIDTLKSIVSKENLKFDNRLFHYIVKKSDGCLRDAQSLLDQIVSYSGKEVNYDDIIKIFGIVEVEVYLKIIDAVIDSNYKEVLNQIHDYLYKGRDFNQLLIEILEQFHIIVLTKSLGTNLIDYKCDISTALMSKYISYADVFSMHQLRKIIQTIIESINLAKYSNQINILVEMTLFKIIEIKNSVNLEFLINKLNEFEDLIKNEGLNNLYSANNINTVKSNLPDTDNVSSSNLTSQNKLNSNSAGDSQLAFESTDYANNSSNSLNNHELSDSVSSENNKKLTFDETVYKKFNEFLKLNNADVLLNAFKNVKIEKIDNGKVYFISNKISDMNKNLILKSVSTITDTLSKIINKKVEVVFNFGKSDGNNAIKNLIQEKKTKIPKEVYENKTVKKVLDLFGGEIVKVE